MSTIWIYWSPMLNDHDFLTVLNDILYHYFRESVVIQLLAWKIPTSDRFQNQFRKKCIFVSPLGLENLDGVLCVALQSYQHLAVLTGHKNHANGKQLIGLQFLVWQNFFHKMPPSGNLNAFKNRTDSQKKILVSIFVVKKHLEFIYCQLLLLPFLTQNSKCKLNFAHVYNTWRS